ncbi:MAG: hypothetical protein ACR2M7_05910, partial [Bdellovibrionales bacterium]
MTKKLKIQLDFKVVNDEEPLIRYLFCKLKNNQINPKNFLKKCEQDDKQKMNNISVTRIKECRSKNLLKKLGEQIRG